MEVKLDRKDLIALCDGIDVPTCIKSENLVEKAGFNDGVFYTLGNLTDFELWELYQLCKSNK